MRAKITKAYHIEDLPSKLFFFESKTAGAKPDEITFQKIMYDQMLLNDLYSKIIRVLNAGGIVQCGVLSGVGFPETVKKKYLEVKKDGFPANKDYHDIEKNYIKKFKIPRPEHYILIFAYEYIEGVPVFLFWDPDAIVSNWYSNLNNNASKWGQGFGCLFGLETHFSTAFDENDFIGVDPNGNHLLKRIRHRYQVYNVGSYPGQYKVRID
jgi:hypothetical protein